MLGPFATASRHSPHCHSPGVATVARRLCINVHNNNDDDDNNDNAWQRGLLWPHTMGPMMMVTLHWWQKDGSLWLTVQNLAAATGKAQLPTVDSLMGGTTKPLSQSQSVTHGQCLIRPTVTLPAAEHCPMATHFLFHRGQAAEMSWATGYIPGCYSHEWKTHLVTNRAQCAVTLLMWQLQCYH